MKTASNRALKPVPDIPRPKERPLNRDLPSVELAEIRRRISLASKRPAPGSSDLLAANLWADEIAFGRRQVRVYDCIGMASVALKRTRC